MKALGTDHEMGVYSVPVSKFNFIRPKQETLGKSISLEAFCWTIHHNSLFLDAAGIYKRLLSFLRPFKRERQRSATCFASLSLLSIRDEYFKRPTKPAEWNGDLFGGWDQQVALY